LRMWTGPGPGPDVSSCEHGDELSGTIEGKKFLNQLSNY
jgi:predicted deacylase